MTAGPFATDETVSAVEDSLDAVSALMSGRKQLPRAKPPEPLGKWTTGQDSLFEIVGVMDAVRVNADTVPLALRSFLR